MWDLLKMKMLETLNILNLLEGMPAGTLTLKYKMLLNIHWSLKNEN